MNHPAPEPLVEVRNLTKHFPLGGGGILGGPRRWIRAVDGVSFTIQPGETLGLVGESGCGKTTTGRSILRLVEPTGGEVRFDGEDLRAMDAAGLRRLRRRAQMVFQDPFSSLNPRMTAGALLEEVLKVHRLGGDHPGRRRRIAELLERVGLHAEHRSRYPHEFSGGQRQRLGIARALAVEPDFIVLDEPVSALDVSVRAQVVNLMRDLQEELGLTYLFIAHDLALVDHLSDRVAVMYLGRIVEEGPAAELFQSPVHPYTRALLSAVPVDEPGGAGRRARTVLPGDVPSPSDPPPGCPFHPRCPHPEKDGECRRILPSLEEVSPGRRAACLKAGGGEQGALDRVGEVES
jgi:oligopeptide/dipeptide ABC transporter ATP-binding protein